MKKSYGKGARLAALGLVTASLAVPAFAGQGMTAAIDAHGKLRQPTAAETKALVSGIEGMSKQAAAANLTQWPDGTVAATLFDAFLSTTLVQVQADGTLQQVCVDSAADASSVLSGTPLAEEK